MPGVVWLLDEEYGIYQYDFNGNIYKESDSYAIRYGSKKLMFRKYSTTIQVVFELKRQTYVA